MTAAHVRVAPYDVTIGDTIAGSHGPAGRVVDIREPRHALAGAYGATVFELERERVLERDRGIFGPVIRWTLTHFPDTPLYRIGGDAGQ